MDRRRFLSIGLPGLGLAVSGQSHGGGRDWTLAQADDGPVSADEVPPIPADPFIITNFGQQFLGAYGGWKPPEGTGGRWAAGEVPTETLRLFLQFQQDIYDFAPLVTYDGDVVPQTHQFHPRAVVLAEATDTPSTAGINPTFPLADDEAARRLGPLMQAHSWTYPDGEPLQHPHGLFGETIEGRPHSVRYAVGGQGIPSPFAPGTLDIVNVATTTRFEQGFSGFELDGVDIFNLHGLDFSVWARHAFRTYLDTLPDSRLSELGIEDPTSFDIVEYLESNGLMPGTGADPRRDPVFREYVLHHHRGLKAFFAAVRAHIEETFPERVANDTAVLWGNQYTGSLNNPQQANVYASDAFDLIYTENGPTVRPASDAKYKYMLAIGRYRKPVTVKGTITGSPGLRDTGEFDPTERYPMLNRFQAAEAYANGAIFKIPMTSRLPADSTVNHWVRTDGTMEPELRTFVDFLWAHERFLAAAEPDNPVAVVWSLPSQIWGRLPGWNIPPNSFNRPGPNSFIGTTTLLREAQIPYDVLVFGQPSLWDDAGQLERLLDYAAVILPNVECLTDAQVSSLDRYLEAGGTVVSSGQPPSRSARFEPLSDVESMFDADNAVILADDPGRNRKETGETDGTLVDTLREHGVEPVTPTEDTALGVNRMVQTEPARLIVHLLNYDYSATADAFSTRRDISLRIPNPGIEVGAARFYAPQIVADLEPTERDGRIHVTVPELVEWGFVVLAPDAGAFDPTTSEQAAREALERANDRLTNLDEAGMGDQPGITIAEVKVRAAETALQYGAYGQAEEAAVEAVDALSRITTPAQPIRTESDAPGFGFGLTLGAVLGASLLRWVRDRDDRE